MEINPFVAGILVTLLVVETAIIIWAFWSSKHQ